MAELQVFLIIVILDILYLLLYKPQAARQCEGTKQNNVLYASLYFFIILHYIIFIISRTIINYFLLHLPRIIMIEKLTT